MLKFKKPTISEEDRIKLSRNTKNIVVFGESGVGKSSLINLIAGEKVCQTSSGAFKCTLEYERHPLDLDGQYFVIWDTAGLDEGTQGSVPAEKAEAYLKQLLHELAKNDGVDLLVYCVRGTRVRSALLMNYHIFYSAICRKKVPIAIVITGLENQEGNMETWWYRNEPQFSQLKMHFDGHACVTTLESSIDNPVVKERRELSRAVVIKMIISICRPQKWTPHERSWVCSAYSDIRAMLSPRDGCGMRPTTVIMWDTTRDRLGDRLTKKRSISFQNPVALSPSHNPLSFRSPLSISNDTFRSKLPFEEGVKCTPERLYRVYQVSPKSGPLSHSSDEEARKASVVKRSADLLIFCVRMEENEYRAVKFQWEYFQSTYGGDLSPQVVVVIGAASQPIAEKWWNEAVGKAVVTNGVDVAHWPLDATWNEVEAARRRLQFLLSDRCIECNKATTRDEKLFRRPPFLAMSNLTRLWAKPDYAGRGDEPPTEQDILTKDGVWYDIPEQNISAPVSPTAVSPTPSDNEETAQSDRKHSEEESPEIKIARLEKTVQQLRSQLIEIQRKADRERADFTQILRAHEQKHHCELLYSEGRTIDAAVALLEITNAASDAVRTNEFIMDWLTEFTNRCVSTLEVIGDEASKAENHDEARAAYSTVLSFGPSAPNTVLIKWASTMLIHGSANEVLDAALKFKLPKFAIYQAICDVLERDDRLAEAISYFSKMQCEVPEEMIIRDDRTAWEHDFRGRCVKQLERLGDAAMDSRNHAQAIEQYSNALELKPDNPRGVLIKRSKVRVVLHLWEEALIDADKVIDLDPSSHEGYERKHAALHGWGRYTEAFSAFKMMLSKLGQSPDPNVRELRRQYVDATETIRNVVEQTVRHMPRVLIDTTTGRLYDKIQQAVAFEELPIYDELRSSMITRLDRAHIRREVKEFYRYVMLSHKWQPNEPTFQMVENTSIFGLPQSPANSKLLKFCELVRSLCFKWAWSDTCCVNQLDKGVQQESLVAMFRWYRGSSLTVVHLLGVLSESQEIGCLWRSIWNTRGWTYQEYLASEVVQFYTEDWEPYLGLKIFNHKESPTILSEMEQAMNFAMQELATLRPGLDRAREKLYLASRRQTTREEDIAYSLFGIFNVALPVIYGEGNRAVGRLLEYLLTRSDNVTLLAWTGSSGSHHSYLPADLTVYNQIEPPHVPPPIETETMDVMVSTLHSSLPDLSPIPLYERLYDLPPLTLVAGRLRLPGIVFPIANLACVSEHNFDADVPVYRATTPMLGDVEIKTTADLSGMEGLLLIHPWISPLLDPDFSSGIARFDLLTRALRMVIRLQQPFGALLLAPLARAQYTRVATDSLIMVQVRRETSLTDLMDGVRTVDIQ